MIVGQKKIKNERKSMDIKKGKRHERDRKKELKNQVGLA